MFVKVNNCQSAAEDRRASMLSSNFRYGISWYTIVACENIMIAPWNLQIGGRGGGDIVIYSPIYITGGAKSDALIFFTSLQRKYLTKKDEIPKKKKKIRVRLKIVIFFSFPGMLDAPGTRL